MHTSALLLEFAAGVKIIVSTSLTGAMRGGRLDHQVFAIATIQSSSRAQLSGNAALVFATGSACAVLRSTSHLHIEIPSANVVFALTQIFAASVFVWVSHTRCPDTQLASIAYGFRTLWAAVFGASFTILAASVYIIFESALCRETINFVHILPHDFGVRANQVTTATMVFNLATLPIIERCIGSFTASRTHAEAFTRDSALICIWARKLGALFAAASAMISIFAYISGAPCCIMGSNPWSIAIHLCAWRCFNATIYCVFGTHFAHSGCHAIFFGSTVLHDHGSTAKTIAGATSIICAFLWRATALCSIVSGIIRVDARGCCTISCFCRFDPHFACGTLPNKLSARLTSITAL